MYCLKEADGDWIQGTFLRISVTESRRDGKTPVSYFKKELKGRGQEANKEVLVHWKGWSRKHVTQVVIYF